MLVDPAYLAPCRALVRYAVCHESCGATFAPTAPLPAPSDHRREVSRIRGNVRGHGLRAPPDSAAVGGLDDARASRAAPSGCVPSPRNAATELRTDVTPLAVDGARPPSPHAARTRHGGCWRIGPAPNGVYHQRQAVRISRRNALRQAQGTAATSHNGAIMRSFTPAQTPGFTRCGFPARPALKQNERSVPLALAESWAERGRC